MKQWADTLVPAERFVTWTELRRQHYTTSRAVPHAAVRVLKSPYFLYLYDTERSTPVPVSLDRQAAIAKAKQTSLMRYTCRLCQEYSASPEERKAFVAQVCGRCQRHITAWNQLVAWAREMRALEAVLLEVETCQPDPSQPEQAVGCTVLDLARGTVLRSGALTPGDAPAVAELLDHYDHPVLTWNGVGLWPLRDWAAATTRQVVLFGRMEELTWRLTHVRQGDRVVVWGMRPHQNGYWVDDLAWCCSAYGVEVGPTRLETMRRLVLHLAAQEPLVLEEPRKEQPTHARRTA